MSHTALLTVDVQNDFLPPDGSMAVEQGRDVIPIIQHLLDPSKYHWDHLIASQDYHPKGHISFASTHGKEPYTQAEVTDAHGKVYSQWMWPDHCVIGSKGAEIDKGLRGTFEPWKGKMKIVRKGSYTKLEAYSVFEGLLFEATDPGEPPKTDGSEVDPVTLPEDSALAKYFREQGIENVVVVGLATDYCVLETAISSLSAGFATLLVAPAMRGIFEKGIESAFRKVEGAGGKIIGRRGEEWEPELRDWIGS